MIALVIFLGVIGVDWLFLKFAEKLLGLEFTPLQEFGLILVGSSLGMLLSFEKNND